MPLLSKEGFEARAGVVACFQQLVAGSADRFLRKMSPHLRGQESGKLGQIVIVAQPESLQKLLPEGTKRVRGLDVTAHSRNFFECIRSRRPTVTNPDVMRRSHIACHAAAIAWVLGRKLKLDPVKEAFVGDEEANRMRSRSTRDWSA